MTNTGRFVVFANIFYLNNTILFAIFVKEKSLNDYYSCTRKPPYDEDSYYNNSSYYFFF